MKKRLFLIIITSLLIVSSCANSKFLTLEPNNYPRVDGSTATIPLAISLRSKITGEDIESLKLSTSHSRTGDSFYRLAEGMSDLLLVYTPLQSVLDDCADKIEMKPIGKDALVFFTNKQNPVNNLTTEQVQNIYQGKIKSWDAVGGENSNIIASQRNEDSGSHVLMRKLMMKELEMEEPRTEYLEMAMGDIVESVAKYKNDEGSIGYSVYYYLKAFIDEGENIKMFDIDGIEPTNENISNGKYHLAEDFYVVIRKDEPADSPARKIFELLTAKEGKDFINSCGYVALP